MRAFILAGGLGTRLKPRFGELPKPLAPVGGRPFLARQLEWLAAAGVRDAVLCTGYGADAVRAALGDGAALGVTLQHSGEEEPLGTGGALQLAARFVTGPCLVANGDTLAPCDPWALERARWESGALGAVALFRVADATGRGRVELGPGGGVARFIEKDPAHAGVPEHVDVAPAMDRAADDRGWARGACRWPSQRRGRRSTPRLGSAPPAGASI